MSLKKYLTSNINTNTNKYLNNQSVENYVETRFATCGEETLTFALLFHLISIQFNG